MVICEHIYTVRINQR